MASAPVSNLEMAGEMLIISKTSVIKANPAWDREVTSAVVLVLC